MRQQRPEWLKIKAPDQERMQQMKGWLDGLSLHTVCEGAQCPNAGECFGSRTATFMILGSVCTRHCRFCAVPDGQVAKVDPDEPERLAQAAAKLGLRHVVVTSVTRDDLPDGGAGHFAAAITALRRHCPEASVEVLIPDLGGDPAALDQVLEAKPDVLNHNIETVPRLYPAVRPEAQYERSLEVLARAAQAGVSRTKSGIMLGLGESRAEVVAVLSDLRRSGCEIVTIGQYLRPSSNHVPMVRYAPPEEFAFYRQEGASLGFASVVAGPLVRSSYHAKETFDEVAKKEFEEELCHG